MSKKERQAPKDEKAKVPGYIVTFSDMVTLLLTFFVLLLSLADMQDPELFNTGRNSFIESIHSMGLGMLVGSPSGIQLQYKKRKYYMDHTETKKQERTVSASQNEISRLINHIRQTMSSMPSQIVGSQAQFSVADISFDDGSTELTEQGKAYLKKLIADLQVTPDSKALYVVGINNKENRNRQNWVVSAKRAESVAEYIDQNAPPDQQWPIYSWGAGSGTHWLGKTGGENLESGVLIAVLRK